MHYRRLAILLLLVALLVALTAWDPVHNAVNQWLEALKPIIRNHDVLGALLFVALSAISAVAFFFSSAVVVPVAVYTWGKAATILLLWCGWFFGAILSYYLGRHPGRRLAKWVVRERSVAKYEKKFTANATFLMVLLFQLAVPSEIPGYVLGTLRYPLPKFLGAFALAEIPIAIGVVYLSDSFVRRQYVPMTVISVAAVLLSATALYFLHKRIDGKKG